MAEGNFLAYSCAAARDLHPLPCLRRRAKTRVPKEFLKSKGNRTNLSGARDEVKWKWLVSALDTVELRSTDGPFDFAQGRLGLAGPT